MSCICCIFKAMTEMMIPIAKHFVGLKPPIRGRILFPAGGTYMGNIKLLNLNGNIWQPFFGHSLVDAKDICPTISVGFYCLSFWELLYFVFFSASN